jgi:hypothetical protein
VQAAAHRLVEQRQAGAASAAIVRPAGRDSKRSAVGGTGRQQRQPRILGCVARTGAAVDERPPHQRTRLDPRLPIVPAQVRQRAGQERPRSERRVDRSVTARRQSGSVEVAVGKLIPTRQPGARARHQQPGQALPPDAIEGAQPMGHREMAQRRPGPPRPIGQPTQLGVEATVVRALGQAEAQLGDGKLEPTGALVRTRPFDVRSLGRAGQCDDRQHGPSSKRQPVHRDF